MHDEMIRKVAEMMGEQAFAYKRLQQATDQLSAALIRGEPNAVESLTRAGEAELLRMRSRLLEITSCLTKFADARSKESEKIALPAAIREEFEAAAKGLIENARSFRKAASKASNLALGGSSFASACIEKCGVPPATYRAPVLRYSEGIQQ